MSKPFNSVEEQRNAVPIGTFVTSKSPHGSLFTMNVFIKPEMLDEYIKVVKPVVHKLRDLPECEICEISVHPQDKGHIRIIHCWPTDSAWFKENVETTAWFGDYIKALAPMRDTSRPRIIEHFDRIII